MELGPAHMLTHCHKHNTVQLGANFFYILQYKVNHEPHTVQNKQDLKHKSLVATACLLLGYTTCLQINLINFNRTNLKVILTLLYTRGLGIVVFHVMVLNHTGFPFAF